MRQRLGGTFMEQRFKRTELEMFKRLLEKHLSLVRGDISQIEEESLSKSFTEQTGELTTMPGDIADLSAESFDHEFGVKMLENKGELAAEIEAAIERIENGSFGLCEECGNPINKERLRAIPYARFCIKCQREMESRGHRRR